MLHGTVGSPYRPTTARARSHAAWASGWCSTEGASCTRDSIRPRHGQQMSKISRNAVPGLPAGRFAWQASLHVGKRRPDRHGATPAGTGSARGVARPVVRPGSGAGGGDRPDRRPSGRPGPGRHRRLPRLRRLLAGLARGRVRPGRPAGLRVQQPPDAGHDARHLARDLHLADVLRAVPGRDARRAGRAGGRVLPVAATGAAGDLGPVDPARDVPVQPAHAGDHRLVGGRRLAVGHAPGAHAGPWGTGEVRPDPPRGAPGLAGRVLRPGRAVLREDAAARAVGLPVHRVPAGRGRAGAQRRRGGTPVLALVAGARRARRWLRDAVHRAGAHRRPPARQHR